MRTAAAAFFLSVLVGAVLTPVVCGLARRLELLDHALSSRKVHGRPVPRLGGIAIVTAFFVPILGLFFTDSAVGELFYSDGRRAFGLIAGGTAIGLLGVYDDLRGSGARTKFAVQFAVALAMYGLGFRVEQIASPFGPHVSLGWLSLPFTVLWIVGVVNAMNLIDGLDGLAGGVAFIAVASTFLVAFDRGQPLMILFTAALGGSVLGFLFYNFNPASIFMGDTGSMFLGFVLAVSAIQANQKGSTAVAMLVPIVALGLPIGDTLLSITRRAVRGQPIFHSDRGHFHHRLMALGFTHRQTVLVLYGLCTVLGATAVLLTRASAGQTLLVLLAWVGYLKVGLARQLFLDRRRNLEMRGALREVGEVMRHAGSLDEIWAGVKRAARALGARGVALTMVERRGGESATRAWSVGFDEAGSDLLRVRYSLLGERPDDGAIELGWGDGRSRVERDTE
ncbi:MAG TPA: MraY family glycosyltransferase, partial [Anaeromyxobacteraceae bacterium]|nr:MraY family glycosyltransferase [Anaeromyxobacteraceae bacterium]